MPSPSSKDNSLRELRQQIKNVMIPLLIKTFELKLSAQQAKNPPSRLQRSAAVSSETIRSELEQIAKDLEVLRLWCESCQRQVGKAIKEIETPQSPSIKASVRAPTEDSASGMLRTLTGKEIS